MKLPRFTVGDVGTRLEGTCTRDPGDGSRVPASGSQVTAAVVHIRRPDGSVMPPRSVTIASDGTWSYTWVAGDLTMPGTWLAEVQMSFGGATGETFGPDTFTVAPQIA